jgi:hypothetical protein
MIYAWDVLRASFTSRFPDVAVPQWQFHLISALDNVFKLEHALRKPNPTAYLLRIQRMKKYIVAHDMSTCGVC